MSAPARYALGVDIGGTFTDVLLMDRQTGELWMAKTPSTPADPVEGFLRGGFVTWEGARWDYGVELDAGSFAVDEVATRKLRQERRRETKMFHRGEYYDRM